MVRNVVVSDVVQRKLAELIDYLKTELKFSDKAVTEYRGRFMTFIGLFGANVDYPLCRFKKWRKLGYRCAVFEKDWVLAYENFHRRRYCSRYEPRQTLERVEKNGQLRSFST
jgi:hypothetical protein